MLGPREGCVLMNGQGFPLAWRTGAGAGEAGSRSSARAPVRAVTWPQRQGGVSARF